MKSIDLDSECVRGDGSSRLAVIWDTDTVKGIKASVSCSLKDPTKQTKNTPRDSRALPFPVPLLSRGPAMPFLFLFPLFFFCFPTFDLSLSLSLQ